MTGTHTLSERNNGGIGVTLAYNFDQKQCEVSVISETHDFTLYPPDCLALQAFYHPFAMAESYLKRGTFAEVS